MIKRSLKGIWRSIAYGVITLAIVLAFLRFTFPYLNRYIPEIESHLSASLRADVKIGQMQARWRGHGPQVVLQDFTLIEPKSKTPVLTLKRFYADLDIWRSIVAFKPVMREFELRGLRATIELDKNGRIVLPGLQLNDNESDLSADYVIDLLMRQQEVAILDTLVTYRRHDEETIDLDLPEMRLRNFATMHQASGDLRVEQGGTAGFVFEFSDYPLAPDDQMSLYVESRQLDLARLPFSTQALGFAIERGTLELKLWAHWRNGSWRNAESKIALHDVQFSNHRQQQKVINEWDTHLWMQRDNNNEWRIFGPRNQIVVDKKSYPNIRVQAHVYHRDDGQRWAVDVGALNAEQGLEWLQFSSATPVQLREKLAQWQPEAVIPLLQFDLQTHDTRRNDWALAAQIENIRYQAVDLPSLQNFKARFAINNQMAALRVVSGENTLSFGSLFRAPLPLQSLNAAVNWSLQDDAPIFFVPYLRVANADADVVARARFDVVPDGAHQLSVQAQVLRGDIAAKSRYLPVSVMSPTLVAYLDRALQSGQLTGAWASLRGPLDKLATASTQSVFAIDADIRRTAYAIDSEWPLAHHIDAHLRFIDEGMDVQLTRATLMDANIGATKIAIANFSEHPQLAIDGALSLNGEQADAIIHASPLKKWIGVIPETFNVGGDFNAQLQLTIPLQGDDPVRVDGHIALPANTVMIKPIALNLTQVQGDVRFNERGLHSGKLRGQGLGGDWQAQIRSDDSGATIQLNGQVDAAVAQDWQFHPLRQRIRGRTAYHGQIEMPRDHSAISVHVNTDLRGIAIDLPAPYGKAADDMRASQFNVAVSDTQLDMAAFLGNNVQMESVRRDNGLWYTELLLNGADYHGDNAGFTVRGELPDVDVQAWLPIIAGMESDPNAVEGNSGFEHAPRLALFFRHANLFGESFSDLMLNAHGEAQYQLHLSSVDLTGSIAIASAGPLQIDLQHLRYGQRAAAGETPTLPPPDDPALLTLTPSDVPAMQLRCRQCSLWGYDLGSVDAQLKNDDQNKLLQMEARKSDLLHAKLNGIWRLNGGTEIDGEVSSKNFGKLFELWQVTGDIKDSAGKISLDMQWAGSPFDYSLRRLHLETDIDWDAGYLNVTPGQKNVGRLLSLTSLQSITRRLTLDFRDLYKDGFFYDGITGHFSLHAGIAHTDRLLIDGTSATVELKGDANMVLRTLDQRAIINPKIDAIPSLALAWMINPAVGVFSWLTSKIWAPKVRVLAQQEMSITGAFDNPVVTEGKRIEKEIDVPENITMESARQNNEPVQP